jgi:PST family polysaccharide transporter
MWLFQGLERMKLAAALFGAARLLNVPALFLFVRHPQDYIIAGAIQASVELTASLLAWPIIFARIQLTWRPPSISDIADSLKRAWPLFLSASAIQLSASSITVILGFVAGKVEVGYFSAADKLIKASIAALNPLGQALYPHITAARLRSPAAALRLIRKSFVAVGALSVFLSVSTALWAGPVCHFILGKPFDRSIAILQCLSPLPLLFGLMSVFGTQTMLVFGMDTVFSRIMLVSAVVGLPVTIILSIWFGAVGAAVASVTTAAIGVAGMWFALRARGMNVWQFSSAEPSTVVNVSCTRGGEE